MSIKPRRLVYPFQVPAVSATLMTHTGARPRDSFCIVTREEQDEQQSDASTQTSTLAADAIRRDGEASQRANVKPQSSDGAGDAASSRSSKKEWEL